VTPLVVIVLLVPFMGWPTYVIGERLDVANPKLAFIPLVGPYIVIWRSIGSSGLKVLFLWIPVVNLAMLIYLAYTVPTRHGRSQAWTLWFVIPLLNIVGFWVYAYTLTPSSTSNPVYSVGAVPPPVASSSAYGPIFKD
jgi:membrane associated rhomboid family serine protease